MVSRSPKPDGPSATAPALISRHPSAGRVITVGIGIAVILALTIAAQIYLSMRSHGHSFVRIFAWQLAAWGFWAVAAPLLLRLGADMLAWRSAPHRYLRVVIAGLLLLLVHAAVTAQFIVWLQPFAPVTTHRYREAFTDEAGALLLSNVMVYIFVVGVGGVLGVLDRARQLELRESQLEAQLARANLDALRLEIQPHFLFNTLNTIAALIRRRSSDGALNMLVGLSDLMRATLERRRVHVTTLNAEVALVRKYIDLYRVRFSDRLEIVYDIDGAAGGCVVPTFILQPLVENAFRHGLARQGRPCRVEIGARVESEKLRLWVADDGAGLAPDFAIARDAGTGLSNVSSRVEGLFGPEAQVDIRALETGGTIASIVIPLAAALPAEVAAS